ncbi:hypothetical protein THRCLA_11188 [Thraustotheca clavata]|uniref:Transmembrane protein n=1 Tax=Thraustotheca clavata TaxID=74557 RepID=A0A1V9Y8H5_9STRA|nr:hypothetical protein THRCLA_11188 [Thraustotheca clavata]
MKLRSTNANPHLTTPQIKKVDLARDLAAARNAYKRQDVNASRAAHTNCVCERPGDKVINEPGHSVNSMKNSLLKIGTESGVTSIGCNLLFVSVLAGNDAEYAFLGREMTRMAIGMAIALAIFTGVLSYRRTEEERFEYERERRREMWELDNFPEGEKEEMVQLYTAKGMSTKDATAVIDLMSKYENFFVDIMMIEELSLLPPNHAISPHLVGLTTCTGGLIMGLLPLAVFHLCLCTLIYSPLNRLSLWWTGTIAVSIFGALLRVFTYTGSDHTKTYSLGRLQIHLPYFIETFLGTFVGMTAAAFVATFISHSL